MKFKMKIKPLIANMLDELDRADDLLSWLYTEHPEIYSEIQDSDLGDMLTQDIRNELDRTDDLLERIDLAMLMSAQVGDVTIPTIEQIYQAEADVELPYNGNYVDTETIYNMVDEWCKNVRTKVKDRRTHMVTVTINMTVKDMDFIKSTLLMAEQNTQVSPRIGIEPEKERVQLANAQINQILNHFGW